MRTSTSTWPWCGASQPAILMNCASSCSGSWTPSPLPPESNLPSSVLSGERRRCDSSKSAFAFVFAKRLDPPRCDIGEATVERCEGFLAEWRTAGVSGATQVFQQEARELGRILRQFVNKTVQGPFVGQTATSTVLSYRDATRHSSTSPY